MSKKKEQLIVTHDNQTFPIGSVLTVIKKTKSLGEYKVVWCSQEGSYEYSIPDFFVHKYCKPYDKKKDSTISIMAEYMKRSKDE